jgi:5'-3' exonuclease
MTDMIVDGNSLYARAWFATNRDYIDVNAVLRSCVQTVCSLLNRDVQRLGARIDRTLFCWDGEHGHDKGDHRVEKPPQYHEGKLILQEALTALLGTAHATPPKHEADDAVATSVENSTAEDIYVVSGDKDLMQLQADHVHYFCLNNKALLSRPFIVNKFSVKHPAQIAIAQAVLGDRIDNIAGIKGWGPKKVKTLFEVVTAEMSFVEALDAIERQVPDCHLEAFYDSLGRTLLDRTLKGLPEPAPLVLMPLEQAFDIGIEGIEDAWARMHGSYSGRRPQTGVRAGMDEDDV